MTDEWYMDMVEKDQDDCTKRLICEISHKKANGKVLKTIEEDIVNIFGEGLSVDTSKTTAVFDFAAQVKVWHKIDFWVEGSSKDQLKKGGNYFRGRVL